MSSVSTPSVKYINAEELAAIIKSKPAAALKEFAVVDVRDSDFVGGNIVKAINQPSEQFHDNVPNLVKRLEEGELYSTVHYLKRGKFGCRLDEKEFFKLKNHPLYRGPKAARIYAETRANLVTEPSVNQEIFVLRDGFSGFQSRYRNDPELVEKFNKLYHD